MKNTAPVTPPAPPREQDLVEWMLDDTDPMIRRFTNTFWTLAALAFLIPVALFFLVVWGDMLWELFFR